MVSIAFVKGLDKKTVKQIESVTERTVDSWSVVKETQNGELQSSLVNLIAIEETPTRSGYTATLRIGLQVVQMEARADGTNYGAYGRLSVSPGDALFDSLRLFWEASQDMPKDDNNRIILEKGGLGRLASLQIVKGVFRVEIDNEPIQGAADVENSMYFRISGYESYGQVSFEVPTGSIAKTSVLNGLFGAPVETQPKSMLSNEKERVSLKNL